MLKLCILESAFAGIVLIMELSKEGRMPERGLRKLFQIQKDSGTAGWETSGCAAFDCGALSLGKEWAEAHFFNAKQAVRNTGLILDYKKILKMALFRHFPQCYNFLYIFFFEEEAEPMKKEKKADVSEKQPMNPMLIVAVILVIVAILTYIIPAGSFDRIPNEETGYDVLDVNSFHFIDRNPVKPLKFFMSLTVGMQSAAPIIFFLLIIGGMFQVVESTGALKSALANMVKVLKGKEILLIPICVFVCGMISATAGTWEEYLALLPLFYVVFISAGFNSITAVASVFCGAGAGYAGATTNAFTVGVAQTIAEVPMFSGLQYRLIICLVLCTIASVFIMVYAYRIRKHPELNDMREIDAANTDAIDINDIEKMSGRQKLTIVIFVLSFVVVSVTVVKLGFYMDEMSAIFLIAALLIAVVCRMKPNDFIDIFLKGASDLVWIGFLIGMCMSISTIMQDAGILDTLIYYIGGLLRGLNAKVCACGMFVVQDLLNCIIPSGSGQAAVTMPFMAPLGDMVGVSRQTSVLAYQMGDAYTNLITPTAGDMMAALAICHIPYKKWLKFFIPLWVIWVAAAFIFLVVAVSIGY